MTSEDIFRQMFVKIEAVYPHDNVKDAKVDGGVEMVDPDMSEVLNTRLRVGRFNCRHKGHHKGYIWVYCSSAPGNTISLLLRRLSLDGVVVLRDGSSHWDLSKIFNNRKHLNDTWVQNLTSQAEFEAMALYYFFAKGVVDFDDMIGSPQVANQTI